MARSREKAKGRKNNGQFASLPYSILHSEEWAGLSPHAVKLLVDLFGQFNGTNNGDLSGAWSIMQRRGWRSKKVYYRAQSELIMKGWIIKTRQGGRRICNLFAVTWLLIDPSKKHDADFPRQVLNTWKKQLR